MSRSDVLGRMDAVVSEVNAVFAGRMNGEKVRTVTHLAGEFTAIQDDSTAPNSQLFAKSTFLRNATPEELVEEADHAVKMMVEYARDAEKLMTQGETDDTESYTSRSRPYDANTENERIGHMQAVPQLSGQSHLRFRQGVNTVISSAAA
jgi:epoxyqueuosine reductase QueG